MERIFVSAPQGRCIGFIDMTKGGFFRAYSFNRGLGFGPFHTEEAARSWITG